MEGSGNAIEGEGGGVSSVIRSADLIYSPDGLVGTRQVHGIASMI